MRQLHRHLYHRFHPAAAAVQPRAGYGHLPGASIVLSAPTGYTYTWSTSSSASAIVTGEAGSYSVAIANRCSIGTDELTLTIKPVPVPGTPILSGDTDLCRGGVVVPGMLTATPSGPFALRWSNGATTPTLPIRLPGLYAVTEYNECGANSDTTYASGCEGIVGMPTAFSPNGDGINDIIRPIIQDERRVQQYHFAVLNRFGQSVFDAVQPGAGWDGRFGGQPQSIGTYFYLLEYQEQMPDGAWKARFAKGDVELIR